LKAVGVHTDVVVITSRVWQTTCTLVRSGSEAFCIDSPVYPDELELVPRIAEEMGFNVVGLLATHADWDHVLGGYAFPEAPLGVGEASVPLLAAAPAELAEFDDEHYVERPSPLELREPQVFPVPGHVGIGERELEVHPAPGHTADGIAILAPWAGVLCVGDYLSPVETPAVRGGQENYLATLDRLEELVRRAEHVVPGHGRVLTSEQALEILGSDRELVRREAPDSPQRRR
jgi:glyoxylase-like metal-dependent hydrolase (beta-lactamase superfamily II)